MKKYALIGEKLTHSMSKVIHTKYFDIKNMDATYDLIEISKDNFDKEFKNLLSRDYVGINVTIPYKTDVIPYLDKISPEAEKIGAINTIKLENGHLTGYNTDFFGLIQTYERYNIEIKDKKVAILGTGGASKAVYATLLHLGAKEIYYVSRDKKMHNGILTKNYNDELSGDVLINATPVGMYPKTNASPVDDINFDTVIDLIYNPEETLLLKKARLMGKKAVNGMYMLISQGLYSQSIWNNTKTEKDVIEKIFNEVK
ncbi:MAG: shikimate dehydrogenase [Ruminococcaceae bacterium]|nr:shikimate dehydrogenase [Oscillospiraceae bacterium]